MRYSLFLKRVLLVLLLLHTASLQPCDGSCSFLIIQVKPAPGHCQPNAHPAIKISNTTVEPLNVKHSPLLMETLLILRTYPSIIAQLQTVSLLHFPMRIHHLTQASLTMWLQIQMTVLLLYTPLISSEWQ